MIDISPAEQDNIIDVKIRDRLTTEDFERFVPYAEEKIQEHGSIRLILEMQEFEGWEAGAMWEDTKFAARHFTDIDRIAMVGDEKWHQGMALFAKPFTLAEVRYFESAHMPYARNWIASSDGE